MQHTRFPLTYFGSLWTPRSVFTGRNYLNWLHMIFVFVFLVGLLMVPTTLQVAGQQTASLNQLVPQLLDVVDEQTVQAVQQATLYEGALDGPAFVTSHELGATAGWLSAEARQEVYQVSGTIVYFDTAGYRLRLSDGTEVRVAYPKDNRLVHVTTVQELKDELSRQWFVANRAQVVLAVLLQAAVLMATNNLFIVLGSAVLLYWAKRTRLFHLTTFKECVNLVLNCLGFGTVVAFLSGLLLRFEVTGMMTIQGIGAVVMLTWVFYRTQFRDATPNNKKNR